MTSAARPDTLPGWPRALPAPLAAAYVGLSVTSIYRLADFPAPVHLSPGRIAWLREDLDRWLDAKAGRMPASTPDDADLGGDWDAALGRAPAIPADRPRPR